MPGGKGNIKPSDNPKPFKKGEPGCGGKKIKLPELQEVIAKVLAEEKDSRSALEVILMAMRGKAAKGDTKAAEILLDRAYGKVKQQVETKMEIEEQVFVIGNQKIKFK